MNPEDNKVSEVSRIYSILIALSVAASVLSLVGVKILLTTM